MTVNSPMKKSNAENCQLIYIGLVAIQFGIQPFLTETFIPNNVIKSSIVLLQELIKGICCIIMLLFTQNIQTLFNEWTFSNSLRIALLPSFIYCTQGILIFYAYQNIDPLLFNLINQTKFIFACIFLKLILNKSQLQTKRKLFSFLLLFVASIILTIDSFNAKIDIYTKNARYGLIALITAAILSGLAGTLTQKALQTNSTNTNSRNSFLFSAELAVYGICCTFFRLFVIELVIPYVNIVSDNALSLDSMSIIKHGFLYNFQLSALIPIISNALGGIGIGLITKYSSVLHKNYSTMLGILLTGAIRLILYSKPISIAMYICLPLVIISLWLNSAVNTDVIINKTSLVKVSGFLFLLGVTVYMYNFYNIGPSNNLYSTIVDQNVKYDNVAEVLMNSNVSNKSVHLIKEHKYSNETYSINTH
eukprot:501126_1